MSDGIYNNKFFDSQLNGSLQSARVVVPLVMDLIAPASVVDIGCGRGAWLKAFGENGVRHLRGFDGDYVDRTKFYINAVCFTPVNLNEKLLVQEKFDLAVCLEVAEHLDETAGAALIEALVSAAPAVLFSAAVPGQTGTHHINEQWFPYWANLFKEHHFHHLDAIRRHIWQDERVEWWYRQNIFLYVAEEFINQSPRLQSEMNFASSTSIELVHSSILNQYRYPSFKKIMKEAPHAFWRSVKRFVP